MLLKRTPIQNAKSWLAEFWMFDEYDWKNYFSLIEKTKQNKTKTKQNKTKQIKTKQNKTKNKTKQNKTKQTKQNKTKQNKTKQNKAKQKQNKTKTKNPLLQMKCLMSVSHWWNNPTTVMQCKSLHLNFEFTIILGFSEEVMSCLYYWNIRKKIYFCLKGHWTTSASSSIFL